MQRTQTIFQKITKSKLQTSLLVALTFGLLILLVVYLDSFLELDYLINVFIFFVSPVLRILDFFLGNFPLSEFVSMIVFFIAVFVQYFIYTYVFLCLFKKYKPAFIKVVVVLAILHFLLGIHIWWGKEILA